MVSPDIARPLLEHIARYVPLTGEDTSRLLAKASHRKYLKGQYVVQQGDVCRFENFVLSGCLKTFYVDEGGQEHIIMFAVEDWWTGDLGSFLNQTPAQYNVQCLEATSLLQFTHDDLEVLYREVPTLERFFRIIIQRAYVALVRRLVANLSLSARERYMGFCEQYPDIERRVPQYMIASYLGVTKEFLSKIRSELAKGES